MASKYKPFINIGPGFYIEEELESRGWSKGDLATIIGISPSQVSEIIHNKRVITLDTAKLLGKAFGQSPQYWLNLYTNYKLREEVTTEAETAAETKANILTHMPIADMVKKGWLPKWNGKLTTLVNSVKKFWDMPELDFSFMEKQVAPAFRKSEAYTKYNQYYALTWYHMAKKCAAKYKVEKYDRKALMDISKELAEYSYYENGIKVFIEDLKNAGVKFLVLPHLEKTYTDGAAFWDDDNPVIVWTGRYKREDNFWFTVAHEIAHILLNLRSKDTFFIDCENMGVDDKEDEANLFAEIAIKRKDILEYIGPGKVTTRQVKDCSEELGISPALIVGQLQHLKILKHYQHRELIVPDVRKYIPKKYLSMN